MRPLEVGNIQVQMMQEKVHLVYVYRMIKLLDKETRTERTVHHFHFTQWPDHGVPDQIKLVSFYRRVKRAKATLNGPLVVHCSDGAGRTGTFIALDALYEHGQKTGYVDIMEYVQMMRKDRMNMIQTKDQYTALYEALLEALTVSNTAIDKEQFCAHLDSHQNKPMPKNQTLLWLEFQKLKNMKPRYPDKFFREAMSRVNIIKNAFQNILPHESYRPSLMSHEKSRNDYINAVIIPECVGKRNIIVTQYPLHNTVVDFWTMVYDTNSTVVVVLELLDKKVRLWPKYGDVFYYDKFNISHSSETSSFPLDITLNNMETNGNKTVRVVSMTEWTTENEPSSAGCMLDLINKVSSWRDDHPGSVTVVCQDGCKRSGVFVALSLVLQKIEIDDEVDIFQMVRTIQIRRPEFFPNFDQYEYCYQCIKEHIELNSIDVNA